MHMQHRYHYVFHTTIVIGLSSLEGLSSSEGIGRICAMAIVRLLLLLLLLHAAHVACKKQDAQTSGASASSIPFKTATPTSSIPPPGSSPQGTHPMRIAFQVIVFIFYPFNSLYDNILYVLCRVNLVHIPKKLLENYWVREY